MNERSAFELIIIVAIGSVVGHVLWTLIGLAWSWMMFRGSVQLNTFITLAGMAGVLTFFIWIGRSIDTNRKM
jgi:hypothetical protein